MPFKYTGFDKRDSTYKDLCKMAKRNLIYYSYIIIKLWTGAFQNKKEETVGKEVSLLQNA